MSKFILYIIAGFFIVAWIIGFFFYSVGAIIHLLLLLALISILLKINKERRDLFPR